MVRGYHSDVHNHQMAVVTGTEGPSSLVSAGDDVIMVKTLVDGTVDALKLELELLPTIGKVGSKSGSIDDYHRRK